MQILELLTTVGDRTMVETLRPLLDLGKISRVGWLGITGDWVFAMTLVEWRWNVAQFSGGGGDTERFHGESFATASVGSDWNWEAWDVLDKQGRLTCCYVTRYFGFGTRTGPATFAVARAG